MPERTSSVGPWLHPLDITCHGPNGDSLGTVRYPAGSRLKMIFQTVDEYTGWPSKASAPDEFDEVEEISSNLASWLGRNLLLDAMVIVSGDAIEELNSICSSGSMGALDGKFVTVKDDEFGQHGLTVKHNASSHDFDVGFQGFKMIPSGGGYGARMIGKESYTYNHCDFSGGQKGIASTGPSSDTNITVVACKFHDIFEGVSAGSYQSKGSILFDDCVFERIGVGEDGVRQSGALLEHGNYSQWHSNAIVKNCFMKHVASHGSQFRSGGKAINSAFYDTSNGLLFGHDKEELPSVAGEIHRCIISDTADVSGSTNTGVGIWAHRASVSITDSVVCRERSRGLGAGIRLQNHSNVVTSNFHVQEVGNVVVVDGDDTKLIGEIHTDGNQVNNVNARRQYSDGGVTPSFDQSSEVSVPDMPSESPEPGHVEAWMNDNFTI